MNGHTSYFPPWVVSGGQGLFWGVIGVLGGYLRGSTWPNAPRRGEEFNLIPSFVIFIFSPCLPPPPLSLLLVRLLGSTCQVHFLVPPIQLHLNTFFPLWLVPTSSDVNLPSSQHYGKSFAAAEAPASLGHFLLRRLQRGRREWARLQYHLNLVLWTCSPS